MELNKNDIIYNIPYEIKYLYNKYIQLAKFKLNYQFLLISDYDKVYELIHNFTNHKDVLAMRNEYNNKVLIFKQYLKNLGGILYHNIPSKHSINIDDITGLWELQSTNNSNIIQYYLSVNNLFINSTDLYFNVERNKTERINQLGFLNEFQYNILYTIKDNNQYLNALKLRLDINPLNLCSKYLKANMLQIIKDLSYNDINGIKEYWLLPEFTDKDLWDINNIFANKLLIKI